MSFKKVIAGATMASLMVPMAAFAQTTTSSSIQALLDQIKALQAQIIALQQQQKTLVQQQNQALKSLVSTLKEGSTGDQVLALQTMLALDPSIYPEGKITGFFGRLTAQAVKRFQKKHGIEQVGFVGPKTLKKLNEMFGKHASSSKGHDDDDDDDDDGKGTVKVTVCHKGETIKVGAPATIAHLNHGDKMGPCSGGDTATTTPDTTAPTLSNVTATNVSTTGATVTWNTNEGATTQVEWGTTVSYGSTSTLNSTLVTSHSVTLSGLANGTTYHYRVISKDAAGNAATSGDMTFTTATVDTVAPTLSAIAAGSLSLTGATITWTTNENSTSQVEYGTTASYGSMTTLDSALVTSHSVGLTGLANGTTYHYRVISKDAANNVATSGDNTFTTTADTTAPVISGTSVSAITSSGASVGWTTNENATSKVYYGTVSPLDLGSALSVSNASLLTGHSLGLSGLSASTTYYYVIESKDAANNTATTSQASFTTI